MEDSRSPCAYNYVVTAQKPTTVAHSAVGHFTGSQDLNLIISKSTRLEIHKLTPEGLQGILDVPIFGRISVLKLFRPSREEKDLIFILTERYKFCILEYKESTGELVTRANGDVSDKVGRPCEAGQIGTIDPNCRMIGLHLYDGHFKIIPIVDGALQEAFNVRLDELKVLDLAFVHGASTPTLAVLYEDTKEQRHIKTYEVSIRDKELVDGPWSQMGLDDGSSMIIPVKNTDGVVVIGGQAAVFLSSTSNCSTTLTPTLAKAYTCIGDDGSRYLLGDYVGKLHLLVLEGTGGKVTSLKLEALGRTSQASALSYLDNGFVFVGSAYGDSQLIRLHAQPIGSEDNYVEVLDTMINLGPIVDFCVMDLDRQGQGQVITCSGGGADGSLRIIRNGIGFVEQASVELPGIKGIWSLRKNFMDAFDTYLVMAFVGETRVLGMNAGDELDEADIPGFDSDSQTLWCGNVVEDQLIQVTSKEIRAINADTKQVVTTWSPPDGKSIIVANGNSSQVCVATNAGNVVLFNIESSGFVEAQQIQIEGEISCLDLSPFGNSAEPARLLAVGTWSVKVHLISLPDLKLLNTHELGGDVIPRSVLFAAFEGSPYFLCGLGDGTLLTFQINEGLELSNRKKLAMGTKPITLREFKARGVSHVFAASDRPTVIYGNNQKLLFSNLNENEVSQLTSFNTSSFPDSLALIKPGSLAIGQMDDIQKLHVRSVPLREQPRRIAHQVESRTLLVTITYAMIGEPVADRLRLIDDQTFETLDVYELKVDEMAISVASLSLSDDAASYFAVGTAIAPPEEQEPSKGRVLLFQVHNGKLQLIYERETRGAVYTINSFHGKLLAGINSRVQLYNWEQQDDGNRTLVPCCSHAGHIMALFTDVRGDFILVGDLMKSLQLLLYKQDENKLELRARDFNVAWMSAVTFLDNDIYLGAENNYNLYAVRKNDDAVEDESRTRLQNVGGYHLGDFINTFRTGSLVMRMPDSALSSIPTKLYATISGAVGIIASIGAEHYSLLSKLQTAMNKVIHGVGGLSHTEYRSFQSPFIKQSESYGFIDGDLVELLLDLPAEKRDAVFAEFEGPVNADSVVQFVEELSRALH